MTILRVLYQPYKWLIAYPLMIIFTILFGTLAVVFSVTIGQRAAVKICGGLWGRLIGCVTPVFVTVTGKENIDRKQSYVVVANHQSFYDVFLMTGWLGMDGRWVMKSELRKIPFLGIACEKVGHVIVDRTNSDSARASIEEAKSRIVNGTSVVFFPEGTRSVDGKIGEFKKGAFYMAFDLGLPILPITIIGTEKIFPATTMDLFPGRAKIVVHKPVDISSYSRENMDALIADIKEIIKSAKR